jgi:hypothetical protein
MKSYYKIDCKNNKWFLIDPDENEFFSLGVDCVTSTDVYISNLIKKFGGGGDWFAKWAEDKLSLLTSLGFNTLGSWHHMHYWGNGYPKTIELYLSRYSKKVNTVWGVGFPDVFDEGFTASIHKALIDTLYAKGNILKEDKGLIGFFTDNELHWWGSAGYWGCNSSARESKSTELVDDYIELSEDKAGKKAWVRFLEGRYGDIENLNTAWDSEYVEFADLLYIGRYKAKDDVIEEDKTKFLELIAEVYFETTSRILKEYFPGTLNLGCRFVGETTPKVVLEVMKKYVDVVSINFYDTLDTFKDYLKFMHGITGKPVMITEFSFCAGREAGFLYNTNGARSVLVRNQVRRGECYKDFVQSAFELPFIVGLHWFALYDYDSNVHGLTGNYGLLDKKDNLWEEFAQMVAAANSEVMSR